MRSLLLVWSLLSFSFTFLFSQKNPIEVSSKIEAITVFKQGAQVSRLAAINISKGKAVYQLADLPSSLNPKSLQLKGEGDFTILSVQQQNKTVTSPIDSVKLQALMAPMDTLNERIEEWNLESKVLQEEEQLILNNDKKAAKENAKLSVEELEAMAIFYRKQISEIRLKKLQLQRKIKAYQKIIRDNNAAIRKVKNAAKSTTTKEVLATILAKENTSGKLKLNYLVPNAGWKPTYDLRVKDVQSPVNLVYKANVYQQSGEEWEEVKLTLSTANPQESGTKSTIGKWNLDFYQAYAKKEKLQEKYYEEENLEIEEISSDKIASLPASTAPSKTKETTAVTTTTLKKATSIEFKIEESYTIKKDGKNYMVNIKEIDIPAYYEYYCAPKLDKDVFLNAMITNWESYNLLSGTTSLYFEGTFLGNAVLEVENLKDTMSLSLGRDKNILVERTLEELYSKKTLLRNKNVEDKAFKIEIRNKKNVPINLVVEDHFPISVNSEIEVKNGAYKGAKLNEKSGILQWKLKIEPEKTKVVSFDYSVKYPTQGQVLLF